MTTLAHPVGTIPIRIEGSPLAVETRGLVKRFGRFRPSLALNGLDLTVPEGAFYLLVGPNGAGKSTTLRILLDILRANEGTATVFGMDSRSGGRVRAQIGWVPETHTHPTPGATVKTILADHAAYYPAWDRDYAAHLIGVFEIRTDRKLSSLSKGETRRVQLLMALAHRPPLLLLDEPTDGLDPFARETVVSVLAEHLAESPTTVIASTHLVDELNGLADHLGVLRNGTMVAQLRRDDLERHLHTYSLEVPAGWNESVRGQLKIVRETTRQREREWTVWGDPGEVARTLDGSGARVRAIHPVSLREAAVALIGRRDGDA